VPEPRQRFTALRRRPLPPSAPQASRRTSSQVTATRRLPYRRACPAFAAETIAAVLLQDPRGRHAGGVFRRFTPTPRPPPRRLV
jgi:hypothetical protein